MRAVVAKFALFGGVLLALSPCQAWAFAYSFAGDTYLDMVTHPIGYTGAGGELTITVGIDPTSANAADMVIPTRNVIYTWNHLTPTTGNLNPSAIPSTSYDFESVLLHEMGHALGLTHPNLATESGLSGSDQNYTKTTKGSNGSYDLGAGADGWIGSADDLRGDDVNLNWFPTANNDPFTIAGTVDSTTYSRDIADLPGGNNFSTNPDRTVAEHVYGLLNTEGVMQQGTYNGETQRTLGHDDVAGIKYAMSGWDEQAGTADDYTIQLTYAGLDATADIVLDFDDTKTSFATTYTSASINTTTQHATISSGVQTYFATTPVTGYTWYYNTVLIPEPAATALGTALALGGVAWMRRRRGRSS